MSDFKQLSDSPDGIQRWGREVDADTWISVIYRLHGMGYETAIVFKHPVEGRPRTFRDAEFLILDGDYREELKDMPKERLREWYAAQMQEEGKP